MPPSPRTWSLRSLGPPLAFLALCAALATYFFLVYAPRARREAHDAALRDLTHLADERETAIETWMAGRLGTARVVAQLPSTVLLAEGRAPEAEARVQREHLGQVLRVFVTDEAIDLVFVADAAGQILAQSAGMAVPRECLDASGAVPGDAHAWIGTHRHADGSTVVQFVVAVGRARVVAESAAETWLCPMAIRPPLDADTAAATLSVLTGDQIVPVCASFAADDLPGPLPLEAPSLPAANAFRRGAVAGEFQDHRDRVVLAVARRLANSPAALVLEVERSEVEARVNGELLQTAGYGGVLLLGAGALLVLGLRYLRREQDLNAARAAARQAALLDRANDAILFVSTDGHILDANRTAERLYGCAKSALVGRHVIRDLRPPDAREPGEVQLAIVKREGRFVFETVHVTADGTRIPVEVSGSRVDDDGGGTLVAVVRDVRERHAAQQRIARLNRLLRMLSAANELLVRIDDEEQLLAAVCQAAVAEGGFDFAWVGRAEPDGRVVPVASAGERAASYLAGIEVRWDESPLASGPAGRCIRERRTLTVGDSSAEAAVKPWRESLQRAGYRCSAASPILLRDGTFGALNLYSTETDVFDAEHCRLIEKLAGDLGFGLQALRDRQQLAASERALADQRRLLERIAELSPVLIYLYDLDEQRVIYSNHRYATHLGYGREEIHVQRPGEAMDLLHPDDRARSAERLARYAAAADGEVIDVEYRQRHKDGSYRWVSAQHVIFSRHEDGRPKQILGVAQDVTERRRLPE